MKNSVHDFGYSPLPVLSRDNAPNPALMRAETLVLDGIWNLAVNGTPLQPVQVPFAPQAQVNAIAIPQGDVRLRYAITFELPNDWEGGLLHFEGVDHDAEIILNGEVLGRHVGAYDPFCFFVPRSVLRLGLPSEATALHMLEVTVRDSDASRTILCGKQERKAREGAIFYANMSGIWKSVWIERVRATYIQDFAVHADSQGNLTVAVEIAGACDDQEVVMTLAREGSDTGFELRAPVRKGRALLAGKVADVHPWSVATPVLYFGALALLDRRSHPVDTVETYVGFRDLVMKDGYYRENGRPFLFQGLLNQAIYPDTLYTPTDAHSLTDFEHTIASGFNGERRHQTTPRHRDLWLADRRGYWLSIELPSARNLRNRKHREQAIREWKGIVQAYAWNHPSVFFLVPGNENWGLLNHAHHNVGSTASEREAFQYELGRVTEEIAPPGMPYAANDGWKCVTSRRSGTSNTRLDPSRLMLNIHEYAENRMVKDIYGDIPAFPRPGTWGKNPAHVFHSKEYSYDGMTPLILSEIGGRALLNRPSKGVFAYGKIHRDPEAWASELAELIGLMGEMPIVRGGYVLTQTRDAGNDPDVETSSGEVNGILDGHGLQKYAGDAIRLANERAKALWANLAWREERLLMAAE